MWPFLSWQTGASLQFAVGLLCWRPLQGNGWERQVTRMFSKLPRLCRNYCLEVILPVSHKPCSTMLSYTLLH